MLYHAKKYMLFLLGFLRYRANSDPDTERFSQLASGLSRALFFIFFLTVVTLHASDSVTILTPANGSSVSGKPLSVTGVASQPNTRVRVTVNTTETGSATTNGLGAWSLTSNNIANGNYTVTADLMNGSGTILATDTNSFTISNAQTISIDTPADGDEIIINPITISGSSSSASTTVNLSVDGSLAGTTTTDSSGNWSVPYTFTANGSHTLLAQLIVALLPVASDTIDITASIPVFFPSGKVQMRVVGGIVPTSGIGSGPGYSYINSGATTTVTFTPAFTSTPAIVATGLRVAGSSTITIASISASAVTFMFSGGSSSIQFTATLFS